MQTWPPPRAPQAAEKLADHRQDYLTFEGEISGGRGRVERVEQGICRVKRGADGGWMILLQSLPAGEKQSLRLRQESGGGWVCAIMTDEPGA
jgi:hypothetical protein